MNNSAVAYLRKAGNRFELAYPEYGLKIHGPHAEWVLEAAADVIARIEKTKLDGAIEELEMLQEFDEEEDHSIAIDSLKYNSKERFDIVPQCVISMADTDYRWVSKIERDLSDKSGFGQRLHDMSMTHKDNWLQNEAEAS